MNFSWFFEEISSQSSPETLSVIRECCLRHFWWKYFHQNSNSYLKAYFLLDSLEIFMLFRSKLASFMRIHHDSTDKTMKIIELFDEIMQKLWLKIGVGNLMKIFFIRNAPNNISWSLKVFPVMTVMMFPFKNHEKSWKFYGFSSEYRL